MKLARMAGNVCSVAAAVAAVTMPFAPLCILNVGFFYGLALVLGMRAPVIVMLRSFGNDLEKRKLQSFVADLGRIVWLVEPNARSPLLTVRHDTPLSSFTCLVLVVFVPGAFVAGSSGLQQLAIGAYLFVASVALLDWMVGNPPWRMALPFFALAGLTAHLWLPWLQLKDLSTVQLMQSWCVVMVVVLCVSALFRWKAPRGIIRAGWQLGILQRELRYRLALPFGVLLNGPALANEIRVDADPLWPEVAHMLIERAQRIVVDLTNAQARGGLAAELTMIRDMAPDRAILVCHRDQLGVALPMIEDHGLGDCHIEPYRKIEELADFLFARLLSAGGEKLPH